MNYHIAAPNSRVPYPFYRLIAFPLKRCLGLFIASLILMFFFNGTVFAELDSLEKYDNFNTKKVNGCKYCIDPEKWRGLQRGDYVTEVTREIKSKRAHLSHRSWGRADEDESTEQGRNRMNFRDSAKFSGACFTPRIKKYEINNCKANDSSGGVRIRYLGNFYDTDNADAGDEDGVVYAWIEMIRSGDTGKKKGIFKIRGSVEECEGVDCDTDAWSTYDGIDDPDLNFGSVKASANKKAMCVGYDRDNHEVVFSFGNKVRVVNAGDHGLPAFGDDVAADWSWHVIETRTDVENCTAGPLTGFIDADIDNVKVRGPFYAIGDAGPAGGIVFHVTDGGLHGLESAQVDQAVSIVEWGCRGTIIPGADGTAIGTGAQNTADILAGCATPGIAARLADAYSLNGFDDWFLPSKDELNQLYLNRAVVGAFGFSGYWSSSEANWEEAWAQGGFSGGVSVQEASEKTGRTGVRAVRAF